MVLTRDQQALQYDNIAILTSFQAEQRGFLPILYMEEIKRSSDSALFLQHFYHNLTYIIANRESKQATLSSSVSRSKRPNNKCSDKDGNVNTTINIKSKASSELE